MNYCSICQQINNCSRSLDDVDEKGVKWFTKLQSIVPELEHSEDCLICNGCIHEVECSLKFKNQLLNFVSRQRKTSIQKEDEYDDDDCLDHEKLLIDDQEIEDHQNHIQNELESVKKISEELVLRDCKVNFVSDTNSSNIAHNGTLEANKGIDDEYSCTKYVCPDFSLKLTSKEDLSQHSSSSQQVYETNKTAKMVEQSIHPNGIREENIPSKKRRGRKPKRICTCEVCGKQFDYIKDIISHCILIHSMDKKSVKPYSCIKCSQRFTSFANYDQHQKYHNKNRDHICSLCGKGFITKSDLMVHEYTHFNRRNYKCSRCDKAFNTNKNLRTHILVVHTESSLWKYACSVCKKRFPLKSNYDQHMRRHSGDKQEVCHICRRSFVTSSELKRHIVLHTNIRPFKCEYCKKDYKEFRTLKAHLKQIHSVGDAKLPIREKKYVCHICPSQFYDKQKLSRHLCSHSGLKPFGCSSCDKKFTDKSYLKYHIKSFHNVMDYIM